MVKAPTTMYTEVQVDDDSISLTVISESPDGVRIEDTERFTFEGLSDMQGEHLTLRLSNESRTALSEAVRASQLSAILEADSLEERAEYLSENPNTEELLAYMGLHKDSQQSVRNEVHAEVGDVVDDAAPPVWSQNPAVEIVSISDKRADEYVIEGHGELGWEKTVADKNPDFPADDPVVIGRYVEGSGKEYAFPASRLPQTLKL